MICLPENGILYHGSYITVKSIDLSMCRSGLDFGKGQAVSYVPASVRKAKRRGLIPDSYEESDGVISVFRFKPNAELFIHCFEDADTEWLHFAACNRSRSLFPELRKKYSTVDIIGGKVADDQTAVTLNNYVSGTYGEPGSERADRIAIEFLEPERLKDQFCFRTPDAVASLEFIRGDLYGRIR